MNFYETLCAEVTFVSTNQLLVVLFTDFLKFLAIYNNINDTA